MNKKFYLFSFVLLIVGVILGLFLGRMLFYVDETSYILKATLKEMGIRYNLSTAFLRQIFPDEIVYIDNGKVTFESYDDSLKRHEYDWRNLVITPQRYDYIVNNKSIVKHGVDVSRFQEEIDWSKVAASDISFAMLRIGYRGYSEGILYVDSYFHDNAINASANNIALGGYFFSQAITVAEAEEEARFVLSLIADHDITYPIVFDMEEIANTKTRSDHLSKEEITQITLAFCKVIKDAGYTPMIYGNSHWFFAKLDLKALEDIPKWYAQYSSEPYYPYAFDIWQYTSSGKVDGIKGNVDLNIAFKTY
ncbi:MAG: glycoside hydrolase family 25 protein [Erysipelotrichaceae bacterium]|nr:glycoside hydrolase family 25 protein [Erysipelotrichaceae bacterium]